MMYVSTSPNCAKLVTDETLRHVYRATPNPPRPPLSPPPCSPTLPCRKRGRIPLTFRWSLVTFLLQPDAPLVLSHLSQKCVSRQGNTYPQAGYLYPNSPFWKPTMRALFCWVSFIIPGHLSFPVIQDIGKTTESELSFAVLRYDFLLFLIMGVYL